MSQFEEEEEAEVVSTDNEVVPETRFANASHDVVTRRRRIEEVVEGKRTRTYTGDYDFDLD